MPYGNNSTKQKSEGDILQLWKGVFYNPFTVVGNYPAHGKVVFHRSGTNAPMVRSKDRPKRTVLAWRYVTRHDGMRKAYKIWSKKHKKWVWARYPVLYRKLVKVPNPNFKKPVRSMDLAPNPLLYRSTTLSYYGDNAVVTSSKGADVAMVSGSLWAPFTPIGASGYGGVNANNYVGPIVSNHFNAAVIECDKKLIPRLYEKVKNQNVNLAQALMEYRQTSSLLLAVAKRIVKTYLLIKSGKLLNALQGLLPGSTADDLSKQHLIYQYAIKPLFSDLEGVVESLTNQRDVTVDIIVKTRVDHPRRRLAGSGTGAGFFRFDDTVYSFGYTEVKYKVRVTMTSPGMALKRTLTEMGFGNLNSLAWESIPFSFVFDWFLPIGAYLNNMDAFDNLVVQSSTKTVFHKEYVDFKRTFGGVIDGRTTSKHVTGFIAERVFCERTLQPVPSIRFPDLKDPVSKLHIANAIALITQLRK